ncbi:MAG TPA: alpha-L-fucosidase [Candidatus Brocadiia bacterium]|nr:alpha-L-fucosidase [Candidatus Brocadiia bacterium]
MRKSKTWAMAGVLIVSSMAITAGAVSAEDAKMAGAEGKTGRADWFKDAKWGVFTHYLGAGGETAEQWNARVDAFDVKGLADQLAEIGAPYYFITIGQNSGHYCAPNETYDEFVGIKPSKCSRRDLISDIHKAIAPKGIRLLVYLPSGGPAADKAASEKLEWRWGTTGGWPQGGGDETGERLEAFQKMWEAVISDWSKRWGGKVSGWWFDGCYFSDAMYKHPDEPNFASFASAARAGNPDSIVAFNPGVLYPIINLTPEEDYTAGEINEPDRVECNGRWVKGAQFHMLSYLGPSWCQSPPRFDNIRAIELTRRVVDNGGVVTWDVPIQSNGLIPLPFVSQLKAIGKDMRTIAK